MLTVDGTKQKPRSLKEIHREVVNAVQSDIVTESHSVEVRHTIHVEIVAKGLDERFKAYSLETKLADRFPEVKFVFNVTHR